MNWSLKRGTGERRRWLSRFLQKYRPMVLVGAALATLGVTQTSWFKWFIPLQKLEQASIDARFRWRANRPAAPEIAIVGISSSSLDSNMVSEADRAKSEALQLMAARPWPWSRKVFALLIEKLFASGAKV